MIGFVLVTMGLSAQTVEEAGTKYNEGNEFVKEQNYAAALPVYEQAFDIAEKVGPDAAELKGNIEKQLGNAYYRAGVDQFKGKKINQSIATLEKGYAFAVKVGDEDLKTKIADLVSQLRTKVGDSMRKKGKLDEAYAEYEMALEIDPSCAKAIYGQGLVFKEKDDLKMLTEKMDQVIVMTDGSEKLQKLADAARKIAGNALVVAGAKELQSGEAKKAIEHINNSFGYEDGDANSYYYLLVAYNKTKQWDDAIISGNKALELKTEDKSEIYFGLGQANEGKGDAAAACEAYNNVTSGPNVDAAKYQIAQVLKCS